MRIWFDTEFIEDGKTIDLLSIGAIREDGAVYYSESAEADHSKASEWVRANVLPHLLGGVARFSRRDIAASFEVFCGQQPELWAYYADYDWVVLCQLYGTMMDLPNGWPMFCRDVKQLCMDRGNPELPSKGDRPVHHALTDAKWTREAWEFLSARPEALEKNDLSVDRAYINGANFGFSCGYHNDRKKFDEAIACRETAIKQSLPSPLLRSQEKNDG